MESSGRGESMEVACLGQPFQLGMLYDCHRDQLVREECFWDSENIEKCTKSSPQRSSWEHQILRENTIESKGEVLKIGDDLLLSFMAGMIPVNGSAKFLHDELATSKTQRVALFVQCTDRFDHLQVEKLGGFPSPDMVKDTEATHIVTGITFGVGAFFVFDKTCEDILDSKSAVEVKNEMEALIKSIPGKLASDAGKAKIFELKCTLYSDVTGQKNPDTWDEAVKAYEELTQLAMLVPIKAQLEPLSKYNSESGCVPAHLISNEVAVEFIQILEHLRTVNFDSIRLLECYPVCSYFTGLGKQLAQFQQILKRYTAKSAKFLQETLPKVRSGFRKEDEIANFVKLTSTSPFGATQLSSWLDAKEEEVQYLTGKLQGLHEIDFAFARKDFFKIIGNDDYNHVLCLNFSLADQDFTLIGMSDYLSNKTSKNDPEIPWYNEKKEMMHMRDTIRHFKEFAKANRDNKRLKCIVSSRSKEGKHCFGIDCYECGMPNGKAFLPPGLPGKLEAANVTHSSVELTWAEPTIGANNVETYCVSYYSSECSADKWHELHTKDATQCLLIDNLQSATCYEFKVRAVCAAGCSQESDIKSIKTLAQQKKFTKPAISSVTTTSVVLTWNECYEEVMYYHITSQKPSSSAVQWTPCGTTQHQETQSSSTVNGLIPNTIYIFKLEAFFKDGSTAASEISEKCQTLCEISFKKPRAIEVTDHSISLEWSPPQHVTEDIESYTILSCECSDVPCGWTSSAMNVKMNKATVAKLKPITKYVFRVIATFQSSNTVTSEISEEICTQSPSPIEFRQPTISKVSHNGAVLVWTKPTGTDVEKYSIYYKCVSQKNEEWHPCGTAQGCDEQATVSCLDSGKEYFLKVSASCLNGEEIEIETITFSTTSIVSLDPPVVVNVSDHEVFLMLSEPHGAQEDVQEYSVTYALLDESLQEFSGWNSSTATIDSVQKQATVTGLRSDSTYIFKAKAIFYSGNAVESKPSNYVKTQHTEAMTIKPNVSRVTCDGVSLTWSKPKEVTVDQYLIYLKKHSGEWTYCGNAAGSEEEMRITGLTSATLYVFSIRAVCTDQQINSEETDPCETNIQFNKPTISGETCSSVSLSWSKPQVMTERVDKYSISYSLLTQLPRQWISSKEIDGMTEETTIPGLYHSSSYVFRVTALFHSGEIATSDVSDEAQTLAKLNMAKPVVCSVTENTVSLKWSTPKELEVNYFTVMYQSFPQSSEKWELVGSASRTDNQMTVNDLKPGTEYRFNVNVTCVNGEMVKSEASDLFQTISFKKPEVLEVRERSAFLQWSKPDGARADVQSYSVFYSLCTDASKPHDWTESQEVVNGSIQGIEIGGLNSNSIYAFKIRAVFEHGSFVDSEPSDEAQTLQKIEIQPPVVSNVTSDSVSLKWMGPDGVEIMHYSVLRRKLSEDSEEWYPYCMCKDYEKETTIQDLNPNTEYVFRIDATTKMGGKIIKSQASAKCKTKPSLHLNKPNIVNVTCRTVTLGWSEPEGVTEGVHEYSVEYCLLSNPAETWEQFEEVVSGTMREIIVTGLSANSAYIFRVKAVFDSRKCVTSDASDGTLTKAYLLKNPNISDITESSFQLTLPKPQESDISHYVIMFQSTSDSSETWCTARDTIAGHREHFTLSQLNPGAKYRFKVIAHCEDGVKVESPVSECETKHLFSLNKPQYSNKEDHAITLVWKKPNDYEAQRVQEYYIAFQTPSAPNEEWTKQLIICTKNIITIPELKAYTVYKFKIIALLISGREIESPCSDLIKTKPPSNLAKPTISSVTNHSVLISWSKPEGVNVDKYSIHYRGEAIFSKYLSGWQESDTIPGTDKTCTIQRLTPNTEYTFKVIAYHDGGKRIESEVSDYTFTKRTLTLHPPTITCVTDHSISLEWIKPTWADENEYQVSNYDVRYCRADDPGVMWTSLATSSLNSRMTLFSLSPCTAYMFDITATLGPENTVRSKATTPVTTKSPCRPGPPKARKNSITDDSIHISWAKPDSCREAVTSYSVVYWKADEHPHKEVSYDCISTENGTVVEDLEPQTKYTFKIRANRKKGKCYESNEETYQTEGPSGVGNLKLDCCTDHTAKISWSKLDTYSRIRYFEISYKPVTMHAQNPTEWTQLKTTTPDQLSMKLIELSPATMYEYMVHALLEADKRGKSFAKGSFKTHDPCCPGKPVSLSLSNNSVTIQWSKPAFHYARICAYTVSYQPSDDTTCAKWNSKYINSVTEKATIDDLRSSTVYYFVIKPETDDPDLGVPSEKSKPIRTKDECRPGTPEILTVRDTSVQLRWAAPEYGASEVEYYKIYLCTTDPEQTWEAFKQLVYAQSDRMITITSLQPKTEYVFKVHVSSKGNLACVESYCSKPTSTKAEPPAKQLQRLCELIREEAPAIYQLPMEITPLDGNKLLRKCEIGIKNRANPGREKVLMLVGATGAGKTTLVNGIANYILGVSWEHNFRFRLIGDEGAESEADSQTQSVTAYKFHKMEGSQLDYTLTIVDTPGFGDTRGLGRDKAIMNLIEQFFSKPGGITFLNGIGFVAQASLARLTPTQKYIFDKVLEIFGKDFINSISVMATFADGKKPPLHAAIDKADLPIHGRYTFNNSGLYEGQESQFASFFFQMGAESFREFFHHFEKAEAISLMLTKEVLAERRRLEATAQSLQEQVHEVLSKMDELRQLEQIVEGHKTKIDQNKDFTFQVIEPKLKKVDLPTGIHTTNCLVCNHTCHENCAYANNDDKDKCCAMDGHGLCCNCPNHCHWKQHVNNPYKFVVEEVTVVKTSKELESKYLTAKSNKSKYEDIIENMTREYESRREQAQDLVKLVKECLEHLAEIALKPDPLTEYEYIDLLIETEKREKKLRWMERVESYESLKQQGNLVQTIYEGGNIFENEV